MRCSNSPLSRPLFYLLFLTRFASLKALSKADNDWKTSSFAVGLGVHLLLPIPTDIGVDFVRRVQVYI